MGAKGEGTQHSAGEHGRGFNIVAQEVGKLSAQARVTAVEATRQSFAEILRPVESVEGQIRRIRTEAAQQEAITQEGVAAISEVKQMAAGMVQSVGDASAATEEALSSMVSIAENSDQVADLAEDLLGDVSKFRV